jgi:hypothetical protein
MKADHPPGAPVFQYDFADVVDAMSAKLYLLERTRVCMIHNTVQTAVRTTIPKPSLFLLRGDSFVQERWTETVPITLYMCPVCNGQAGLWGDKKLQKPSQRPSGRQYGLSDRTGQYHAFFR